MSRRSKPTKRIPLPDPFFNDVEVAKFINRLMIKGKKSTAERVFYNALESLDGKTDEKPIEVFRKVLRKVKPLVRVKARRVGGSTYQVPIEVREDEGIAIGTRWLIGYARSRNGRSMEEKLAAEILDAYKGTGATMKKREDTHKMAEANKAFAHYRY
ncbi:MAG: 30S ribosomal protein S7 [Cyanobacteria bacterium]|jgi:small subunit ribosomal protein S7|nr:30S ribosomal protein S7 [Cyanobacteriota bacterium]